MQACFSHYRAALRGRGIVVPEGWDHAPGNPSHTGLVAAVRDGGDLARAAEVLAQARALGGEILLISAEDLAGLNVTALQRLRELLGETDISIIYYVRRWSDILPSEWQELVKHGHTMSLPEYMAINLRNPETSQAFNLEMRLGKFVEVFGLDSIKLVSYSVLRDNSQDMFVHFCKNFLGWWQAEAMPGNIDMNVSRSPVQVELLRMLNALEFSRTGVRTASLRGRLYAAWGKLDLAALTEAMQRHQKIFVFSDAYPMLLNMHRAAQLRYRANIVKPCPPDLFFRPLRKEIPYFDSDYLLQPGVVDAINAAYRALVPV